MVVTVNPTDCTVGEVTFESSTRNNWASAPARPAAGSNGRGGLPPGTGPARLLRPGDAVSIAPGVVHWHGATATTLFTYLTINPGVGKGVADWGAPVVAAEYQAAHAGSWLCSAYALAQGRWPLGPCFPLPCDCPSSPS